MQTYQFKSTIEGREGIATVSAPDRITAIRKAHDLFDDACRKARKPIPEIRTVRQMELVNVRHS